MNTSATYVVEAFFVLSLITGGGTMYNKLFTKKEQEILKSSKWVKIVTDKSVSFIDYFKLEFLNQYNLGNVHLAYRTVVTHLVAGNIY